jgi:hypothetical protein
MLKKMFNGPVTDLGQRLGGVGVVEKGNRLKTHMRCIAYNCYTGYTKSALHSSIEPHEAHSNQSIVLL